MMADHLLDHSYSKLAEIDANASVLSKEKLIPISHWREVASQYREYSVADSTSKHVSF